MEKAMMRQSSKRKNSSKPGHVVDVNRTKTGTNEHLRTLFGTSYLRSVFRERKVGIRSAAAVVLVAAAAAAA